MDSANPTQLVECVVTSGIHQTTPDSKRCTEIAVPAKAGLSQCGRFKEKLFQVFDFKLHKQINSG